MTSKTSFHFNDLLKYYVTENHGDKVWNTVLKRVGLNEDFANDSSFDITSTEKAIAVILDITDISKEAFLEGLGEYSFQCMLRSENLMLRNVARDWLEFLQNLDYLQWITGEQILGPSAQTFRYEPGITQDNVFLHCYSIHAGYYSMIKGALTTALNELYAKEPLFELKSVRQEAVGQLTSQMREHVVFQISTKDAERRPDIIPPTFVCQTRKFSERQILAEDVISHKNSASVFSKTSRIESQRDKDVAGIRSKKRSQVTSRHMDSLPVSPFMFVRILPYHVIFNSSMMILQTGVSLQQQLPGTTRGQPLLSAFFELANPSLAELSFNNIQRFINSPFVLKVKQTAMAKGEAVNSPLLLKGEMVLLQDTGLVLYLCSPLVRSFQELQNCAVTLCDLPLHDATRDLLFQSNHHRDVHNYTSSERSLFAPGILQSKTPHTYERKKTIKTELNGFTTVLLPKAMKIATAKEQLPKPAHSSSVTVLFCDIVNFASMTKTCSPVAIVEMINELYRRFDEATDLYNTCRVESIGDAYLVLCGAPHAVPDHVSRIANTSLAILAGSKQVRAPNKIGSFVSVRIGVHTGGLIWGIIREQVPRFVIMGETVMIASRMESHGRPDMVHITQQVYEFNNSSLLQFQSWKD